MNFYVHLRADKAHPWKQEAVKIQQPAAIYWMNGFGRLLLGRWRVRCGNSFQNTPLSILKYRTSGWPLRSMCWQGTLCSYSLENLHFCLWSNMRAVSKRTLGEAHYWLTLMNTATLYIAVVVCKPLFMSSSHFAGVPNVVTNENLPPWQEGSALKREFHLKIYIKARGDVK